MANETTILETDPKGDFLPEANKPDAKIIGLPAKITGKGGLEKKGLDTILELNPPDTSASDYTGPTLITEGILKVSTKSALGNTQAITISKGATLNVNISLELGLETFTAEAGSIILIEDNFTLTIKV